MTTFFKCMLALMMMVPWSAAAGQQQRPQETRSPHGPLNMACDNCHTFTGWKPIRSKPEFDHSKTKYPLLGMHQRVACMQCHTSPVFSNVGTKCADCHADIHKGQFGANCEQCHTVKGWQVSIQQTREHFNRFPLIGAHAVLECDACHKGAAVGQFRGLSTDCISCHVQSYTQTNAPNHKAAGFGTDCRTCHVSMDSWFSATFDHLKFTGFALTGAHATLECTSCHIGGKFQGTSADCFSCHAKDYNGTKNPNHAAAGISTTCQTCHTTVAWQPAKFDHNQTKFPLTGAHVKVDCASCHVGGNYSSISTDCSSCHLKDYQGAKSPDHVAAGMPTTCQVCHSTTAWQPASFDHSTTKFPLTGAHVNVACASCHVGGNYTAISTDCSSCHLKDYQGAKSPDHVAAGMPTTCQVCHSTTAWQPASFDHSKTTFPLTGAHVNVACASCHVGGNYTAISTDCSSCHLKDYQGAKNPDHVASGIPTTCAVCHSTSAWQPASFDHSKTKFPLTGAHVNVTCASCHVGGNYTAISTDCSSCHLKDYQGAKNPDHVASGFPTTCQTCHNTTAWQPATFDHSTTKFPLTGAHVTVPCASCHVGGNYTAISTDCSSCHLKDYQGAKNPDHVAAGFPTTCQTCHSTTAWQPSTFNHNTTGFPLTGAHVTVACASCHVGGKYAGTPTDCASCHMTDFQGTTNPNHVAAAFPTTCQTCHSTTAWSPATFDHNTYTKFPLTGAHVNVACASCHTNGNYTTTPTDCYSCHKADYTGTTNPNHVAAGFPTDCSVCHSTTSWSGATFDHSTTGFPLTGAHVSVACASCHTNGNYSLSSTACSSCHTNDYNGTTNPNHKTAGFPMDCTLCHTTAAWQPSTFNHNNTPFPLTGAHTTVACASCHINGNYTTTPTDCYSCHKADYTGTTNPNHAAAMFPTTCGTCHTTTAWTGATFNHTWFPIYSGTHAGRWTTCGDCHTDTSNYAIFSCITCHQHSQANTDGNHQGVRNYVYNATSCYSCHPTGNGG